MAKRKRASRFPKAPSPTPPAKRRLLGRKANKLQVGDASPTRPFTEDDAVTLYRQAKAFEKAYKDEGYKVSDNASKKEIELAMIRGTLNLRVREISLALFHNFVAYPTDTRSLPACDPTTLLLRDYGDSLKSVNAGWARLVAYKRHRQEDADAELRRRKRSARHEMVAQADWWKAAREEKKEQAYDADDEDAAAGLLHPREVAKKKRKERERWYDAMKKLLRREGQVLSAHEPGLYREWETDDDASDEDEIAPAAVRAENDLGIPSHVKSRADMLVYLNQLGVCFTPGPRPKKRRMSGKQSKCKLRR